jgi:phosphopantothenoylcysteine decarboxylase/phosphopantothenate--cysteine ligase
MSRLAGKRILLGITGGIAAYKCAYLVRLLVQEGADVQVIMTPEATAFIGPVTLSTLSRKPVYIDYFDKSSGNWANHVALGTWPDLFLIAPLTANTMSKMVQGSAENLLLAVYLSARCPVAVAPAMDLDMWKHAATVANLETLKARGTEIIGPDSGFLASGLSGEGRMSEPSEILEAICERLGRQHQPLFGKKVLITAGPTHEPIDPVRFIGNHSTGKMGFALASAFFNNGADVIVVHGPVTIQLSDYPFQLHAVTTAQEMLQAAQLYASEADIIVAAAAVADFTPANPAAEKIKKSSNPEEGMTIELVRNPDILATLSSNRVPGQIIGGFALESNDGEHNAALKLNKKGLDFIVLNSLEDAGAGFAHDTNKISILDRSNKFTKFELKNKSAVAIDIVHHIIQLSHA